MRILVLVALALVGSFSSARVSKSEVDSAVKAFFTKSFKPQVRMTAIGSLGDRALTGIDCDDDEDDPNRESCRDVACEFLGSLNCNDLDELKQVGQACRGNRNGSCLRTTCALLGSLNCNDIDEVREAAALCRGHFNGGCFDEVCTRLGSLSCNDTDELRQVGTACRGVSRRCIAETCDAIGALNCNDIDEIREVATSCRGED